MKLSWVEQKAQMGTSSDQMTSGRCGKLLASDASRCLPIARWIERKKFLWHRNCLLADFDGEILALTCKSD